MALELLRARLGLSIDDEVRIIHGTVDPSQAPGVFAERASLFMQDTGASGLLWIKVGDLDTDWAVVGTGGEYGVTGIQGETGLQGATGPAGLGTTGLSGVTGIQGLSGDGITWIHAAMLGSATSTFGQFSIQAGNANPFGTPINSPYDQYNNGGVNAIKIPFDYELKEVYLSLGHCAVDAASADSIVYANIEFHKFEGLYSTSLGTVKVPLDGTNCGVFNNLGGNNFQKSTVVDISGIDGTIGDLIGFRFQNVSGTSDINALSRCTILAKLQKKNWTPGGTKGETGLQGATGIPGATGSPGDISIWSQASLLGQAVSTIGYFSTQPGNSNPFGVPVASGAASYGNGGVNPYRMPWSYYVAEVHVTLAHCAVSTASANSTVNFNLDFYGYTGTGNALKGRVSIPINGSNCGVYNNLGGDNYQYAGLTGLSSITGFMGELVGFQFQNVSGPSDLNAVSRASVLVRFQKM